ncbi:MAG: ferrous iron transport protein A [Promethearchaeota archaeon]
MDSEFNNYLPRNHKKIPNLKYLNECPIGQKFIVQRVNAGYHAKRRLACLGIIPGVEIVIKKAAPFRGPIEIIVKGSSLVIGRGLASKIIVK